MDVGFKCLIVGRSFRFEFLLLKSLLSHVFVQQVVKLFDFMIFLLNLLSHVSEISNHVLVKFALEDFISSRERYLHVSIVQSVNLMKLLIRTVNISHIYNCIRKHACVS